MNEYTIYKHQSSMVQELKRLMNSSLPEKTKKQIQEFAQMRLAKGSTKLRVVKCMWCIRIMATWLNKDFKKATKNDLLNLISTIDMKSYSEYTKYDFKVVLKMFYKWFKRNDESSPPEISWLKPKIKNGRHKLPEELLTENEIIKISETADTLNIVCNFSKYLCSFQRFGYKSPTYLWCNLIREFLVKRNCHVF